MGTLDEQEGLVFGPPLIGWPEDIWNEPNSEPVQFACGMWVERSESEQGFCTLSPAHQGDCQP